MSCLSSNPRGHTYLRLSVTDRCNLRCRYCRPGSGPDEPESSNLAVESELLEMVRLVHEETGICKLRFSGGEPLLYGNLAGLVAQSRRLLPEATIGMTTNGILLGQAAGALRAVGLDTVNISLDSLDPEQFRDITGGGNLDGTLQGIDLALQAGFTSTKLNSVLIRRINGNQLPSLVRFAAQIHCEIRFIELMPFGQGAQLFQSDYLAADEALESLKSTFEYLSAAPATGTATRHRFLVDGRVTTVGLIRPVSEPFCSRCGRLRLTRTGRLYACLRQSFHVDLLGPLRAGAPETVRERIRSSMHGKTHPGHHWPERHMVTIGG